MPPRRRFHATLNAFAASFTFQSRPDKGCRHWVKKVREHFCNVPHTTGHLIVAIPRTLSRPKPQSTRSAFPAPAPRAAHQLHDGIRHNRAQPPAAGRDRELEQYRLRIASQINSTLDIVRPHSRDRPSPSTSWRQEHKDALKPPSDAANQGNTLRKPTAASQYRAGGCQIEVVGLEETANGSGKAATVGLCAGFAILAGCHRAAPVPEPPLATVTVAHPVQRQVIDWDDYAAASRQWSPWKYAPASPDCWNR